MKMENSLVFILSLLVLAEVADLSFSSPIIPQRSLRDIVYKRRQLSYIKNLLQDLDDKLEKLEKRSCAINIPGSDCDYSEISGTGKDQGFWNSRLVPGKRLRYRRNLENVF
ncbi:hypothetical protein JTE90_013608 [Oedothorax gibbosus]|uniref:Uncharacterized protein n=1 Tax=Oedothorax gibbosus TaxID=931172 RepID=A0AAV6VHD1_9ARAC|nr:hypothetical protein JTE90_013608 [Oedothorax gibbosus]